MGEELRPPVRVNTRISAKHNDWLDQRSNDAAISKSGLINFAIENYIVQNQMSEYMPELLQKADRIDFLADQVEQLQKKLNDLEKNK